VRALQERLDDAHVAFSRATHTHTAPSDAKVYNSHGVVLEQVYTFYQYKHTHTHSRTHTCATRITLSHTPAPLILLRSMTLTALFLSRCTHDTSINIHTLFSSHTHVRHAYFTLSRTRASHTSTIYDSHGVILEQVYILNQCTHTHTNSHTYTCAAPILRSLSLTHTRAIHTATIYNPNSVVLEQVYTFNQYTHTHTLSHTYTRTLSDPHTHVRHSYCVLSFSRTHHAYYHDLLHTQRCTLARVYIQAV